MLAHAHAEDQGRGHARGEDGPRLVGTDHGHGIRAVRLPQRPRKGFEQGGSVSAALGDQMGQHFRIGFGLEDVPLGKQALLQFLKVFDDAVMDDGELVVAADMGMRVAFGGHAVGGPARMPDAVHGYHVGETGKFFLKGGQFAFGLDDLQFPALNEANPGGIVSAVFKTPKTFDNDRNRRTVSGITNNSAHAVLLLPFTGTAPGHRTPPGAAVPLYSLSSGRFQCDGKRDCCKYDPPRFIKSCNPLDTQMICIAVFPC